VPVRIVSSISGLAMAAATSLPGPGLVTVSGLLALPPAALVQS